MADMEGKAWVKSGESVYILIYMDGNGTRIIMSEGCVIFCGNFPEPLRP
jgi:hypothetical protein